MKKMNALSKTEMKKVLGGVDSIDWCAGHGWTVVCDWTCHNLDESTHLGRMTCNDAQAACPFGRTSGGDCSVS